MRQKGEKRQNNVQEKDMNRRRCCLLKSDNDSTREHVGIDFEMQMENVDM